MQRISAGTVFLAFLAVLFGLLGVYAVRKIAQPREVTTKAPQRMVVPLASRHLEPGRVVSLSDVALVKMTREQMFKRNIPKMFMTDPQQIIGQTVMSSISRGKTFDTQNFYPVGYRPNVADQLKVGQRAVSIKVSSENGLGGYASAGQLVDIIFRFGDGENGVGMGDSGSAGRAQTWHPGFGYHAEPSGSGGGFGYTYDDRVSTRSGDPRDENASPYVNSTVTLMQGIKILALEDNSVAKAAQEVSKDEPLRVTVAVTPDQAETLQLVQKYGTLVLSLRNPGDTEIVEPVSAQTLEDLLGIATREPSMRRKVEVTEVYMGSSKSVRQFDSRHPLAIRETGFLSQVMDETKPIQKTETKPTSVRREDIFEMETTQP